MPDHQTELDPELVEEGKRLVSRYVRIAARLCLAGGVMTFGAVLIILYEMPKALSFVLMTLVLCMFGAGWTLREKATFLAAKKSMRARDQRKK